VSPFFPFLAPSLKFSSVESTPTSTVLYSKSDLLPFPPRSWAKEPANSPDRVPRYAEKLALRPSMDFSPARLNIVWSTITPRRIVNNYCFPSHAPPEKVCNRTCVLTRPLDSPSRFSVFHLACPIELFVSQFFPPPFQIL